MSSLSVAMSSLHAGPSFVCVAAVALAIWVMGPLVMNRLGLLQLHSYPIANPAAAEPDGGDIGYRQRFDQFAALGFQPAGADIEVGWFLTVWDWRKQFEQKWLVSAEGDTFTTLYRLIPEEPWRFGLVTMVTGGRLVRTSCPGVAGLDNPGGGYHVARFPGVEPAELLARHREHVEAVCSERSATIESTTFPEVARLEASIGEAFLNGPARPRATVWPFFIAPPLLALLTLAAPHGGVRVIDVVYALGIGAIATRLFRDFIMKPLIRSAMLASHSEPRR